MAPEAGRTKASPLLAPLPALEPLAEVLRPTFRWVSSLNNQARLVLLGAEAGTIAPVTIVTTDTEGLVVKVSKTMRHRRLRLHSRLTLAWHRRLSAARSWQRLGFTYRSLSTSCLSTVDIQASPSINLGQRKVFLRRDLHRRSLVARRRTVDGGLLLITLSTFRRIDSTVGQELGVVI